jgi:AcrR family transcriptional regulator
MGPRGTLGFVAPMRGQARTDRGERTRRALLAAAVERFAQRGYRATSVAEIARAAGVSPPAAYVYFPTKEALFLAAVDEDAAGEIGEALPDVLEGRFEGDWTGLVRRLLEGLDRHPLARRVLAGLEPGFTDRLLAIPALEQLRKALGELLAAGQLAGTVRRDIDPHKVGRGLVTIVMALLIAVLQTGADPAGPLGDEVLAVLEAAIAEHARTQGADVRPS